MVQVKRRNSLKWKFMVYMPICMFVVLLGSGLIGMANNYLQDWYQMRYFGGYNAISMYYTDNGELYAEDQSDYFYPPQNMENAGYLLISSVQIVLVPLWAVTCILVAGILFYKREMEGSIHILIDSAKKIADNCLDFQLEAVKANELGMVCDAFEYMRRALYQTNQENFRIVDESRRLNAAFSHDMRTPITVLKGYSDLLEKYIPDGMISQQKLLEILDMMQGQILRLERYTQKMGSMQKLEDVVCCPHKVDWEEFMGNISGIANVLAKGLSIEWDDHVRLTQIWMDEEIALEVYENILSNAVRHAKSRIIVVTDMSGGNLQLTVEDDGAGFSKEALSKAMQPFYSEDKWENQSHFGLGLYISRVLCERCKGELRVENSDSGAKVTAVFGGAKGNCDV